MMLEPVSDNIIVEVLSEKVNDVTVSGIYIPKSNTAQAKPDRGTVVAVGTGRILNNGTVVKPLVKVEDEIIFSRFAGTEVINGDKTYLIIKENDVMARILKG